MCEHLVASARIRELLVQLECRGLFHPLYQAPMFGLRGTARCLPSAVSVQDLPFFFIEHLILWVWLEEESSLLLVLFSFVVFVFSCHSPSC